MNGIKNEVILKRLKREMERNNIEVLFVTETLGSEDREKEMRKVFKEYDIIFRGRRKKKSKKYVVRGGVVCIAKKGTVKAEKESKQDDVMYVTWNNIYIACAYLVPPTSPFESMNEKKMEEIQERLVQRDRCMLMVDSNAWIGEMPSVVAKGDIDGEQEETSYERKSEKKEINKQGEKFIEDMNSTNMIILNGVRHIAKYTYDHVGREAKSVIDYIVVSRDMYTKTSDITYVDCRERVDTDHILLYVDVNVDEQTVLPTQEQKKQIHRRKKSKRPVMNALKNITRKDPFWKVLESVCDRNFENFDINRENTVEEAYTTLKQTITDSVKESLAQAKPINITLTAKLRTNSNVTFCRKRKRDLFQRMLKETDVTKKKVLKKELSRVGNQMRRLTKKAVNGYKRQRVKEIEELETNDCKRMWKELKKLTVWSRKDEISDVMLNEKKEEVCGEEVKEVWKEAFRVLGIEDIQDERFDTQFCKDTIEKQKEIEVNSYSEENVKEELDREIEEKETQDAVIRLKTGKAGGCDEVVAEVLKKGGENIVKALHKMCEKVWQEETLPTDWTRGIIFPIYKDGDNRDPSNYRGITLLSIVGKVYAQILNDRLVRWSEKHKIIVEEQGGFRPRRGCPDQLFTLVELLRNRGKKGTYCCFIDVKKAFDRVFRAGLWERVAEEGVRGKMWRVLVSIYNTVESCVKVKEDLTEWFPVSTGVRQGCILSPFLYALFINGLVREINALNLGVKINNEYKLSALLYADDIVLIAEHRYALQKMLDVVSKYAQKWRFELNPKKSEVVVFGEKYPPRNVQWKLGGQIIRQVTKYKYLGIELTRTLKWHVYIKRILCKARRNMTQALGMGIRGGYMRVRLANIIWMALVRSIVEYGCEVWGERTCTDIENLQLYMGKKILRCSSRTNEEVVRGELGWERQKARFDELRLRYWGKIIRMTEDRIVKKVYKESRARLEQEEKKREGGEEIKITDTWCKYTRDLMCELQLGQVWREQRVPVSEEEWNKTVRDRIHTREQIHWRTSCLTKPKLRTYVKIKRVLRKEPLLNVHHRRGIPEMVKIRGGTNRLRIEKGRYKKESVEQRICLFCEAKEVEDEKHFILECTAYAKEREEMWREYERITRTSRASLGSDTDAELAALVGDTHQPAEEEDKDSDRTKTYNNLVHTVMKYITSAMRRRKRMEQEESLKSTEVDASDFPSCPEEA